MTSYSFPLTVNPLLEIALIIAAVAYVIRGVKLPAASCGASQRNTNLRGQAPAPHQPFLPTASCGASWLVVKGTALYTTIEAVALRCSRALGAVFLILATVPVCGQVIFISGASETPGVVVGNRTVSGEGRTYAPVVEFVNARDQKETFESHVGTNPPAFREGQQVTVLVSADGRRKAISTFGQLWLSSVMLGGVGLILGAPGVAVPVVRARRQAFRKLLRETGAVMELDDFEVRVNESVGNDDVNTWYVTAIATIHGQPIVFRSRNIWKDPTEALRGRKLRVYYLRDAPKKHWVDIDFLCEACAGQADPQR